MNDTSENFKAYYHRKIMERSGKERMMMGDSMFSTARELALTSLSNTMTSDEKRFQLFLRFYGNDFASERQKQIKNILLVRPE